MTDREILEHLLKSQRAFNSRLDNLEVEIEKINAGQIRLENGLTGKVKALFDDRSVNQDYFKSIKKAMARVENEMRTQSFLIIGLKEKQEDHETELRLLRAEK